MERLEIAGIECQALKLQLPHAVLLLLQTPSGGMLSCGYLNMEAADKFGDVLAIVSGVSDYADLLSGKVSKVSRAAAALGVAIGMRGEEALLKMDGSTAPDFTV